MRVINVGVLRQKNIKLRLERPAKFKQDTCMHAPLMAKNVLHAFVNFYILVYNQNRAFFILTITLIFGGWNPPTSALTGLNSCVKKLYYVLNTISWSCAGPKRSHVLFVLLYRKVSLVWFLPGWEGRICGWRNWTLYTFCCFSWVIIDLMINHIITDYTHNWSEQF